MHVFWLIYKREVEIFGHVATANDVVYRTFPWDCRWEEKTE